MSAQNRLKASSELPIYSLPQGHNLDDGYLETGIDLKPDQRATEPVTDPQVPLNAAARLASILNTVQNESTDTFISHTVEAEDRADSEPDSDIARTLKRVSESQ